VKADSKKCILFIKGGSSSGNHGHKGRHGLVGGSAPTVDPEADRIMGAVVGHAAAWRHVPATAEQWKIDFGDPPIATTPIGDVKLGDNQLQKLIDSKRSDQMGLIKPTLEEPTFIIERSEHNPNKDRASKLIFVRAFYRADKSLLCFTSVSVLRGNVEVAISNHPEEMRRIIKWVRNEVLLHSVPTYSKSADSGSEPHLVKSVSGSPDMVILRYIIPECNMAVV